MPTHKSPIFFSTLRGEISTTKDGTLYLNFTACVLFVNKLPGPLASRMQLRSSYFDAFTDIGSAHAKAFLIAKLARAAAEPVAAQLRAELDSPSEVSGQQSSDAALRTWLESRLDALEGMVRASNLNAPGHGVLEISRSRLTSFYQKLRGIGTPVDDSYLATIDADKPSQKDRLAKKRSEAFWR